MEAGDAELVHFFQGAAEWLTLLLVLAVVLRSWAWAADRRLRPVDRGQHAAWLLLILAFGLAVLVRELHAEWPVALALVGGVLIAGLLSRMVQGMQLGLPAMILAGLLGLGHVLSALVFALAGFLLFLLGRVAR